MPEVDLYLRKSKKTRQGKEELTFRAQEERGRRWAADNGYTVRKVWKDNLSAWSDIVRPDFDKALDVLKSGEVPALWAYALDRFTRKGIDDVGPILSNARVIFDFERLDSSEERDRQWIIMRAEQAREYSMLMSHRVRDTKNRQRNEGAWLSAAPYGLEIADKRTRKLHHSREWPNVVRVIELVASGHSGRSTAREMRADGVRAPDGGDWAAGTVRRIVFNPVYEGWQVVAKSRKHTWPVLYRNEAGERVGVFAEGAEPIDGELVRRARRVMQGHQPGPQGPRSGRATHLLTDLLRCEGCGARMPASGRSYACNGHVMGKGCPRPASVMRSLSDEFAALRWLARLTNAEPEDPLMVIVAERWAALTEPEETAEAQDAIAGVKAAEAGVQRLVEDRQAGLYDGHAGTHYPRLLREAEATLAVAEERAAELTAPTAEIGFLMEEELARAAWECADLPLRRDLLRLVFDEITVTQAPRRGAPFDGHQRMTFREVGQK